MADNTYYVPTIVKGSGTPSDNPLPVTQAPKSSFQTMKTFTGTVSTSSTSTVVTNTGYTVTAGKTFYLTDVAVCSNTSVAGQVSVNNSASAGVGAIINGHAINTSPFVVTNIGTEPSIAAGNPVTIQITPSGSTATTFTYFISGYEQ